MDASSVLMQRQDMSSSTLLSAAAWLPLPLHVSNFVEEAKYHVKPPLQDGMEDCAGHHLPCDRCVHASVRMHVQIARVQCRRRHAVFLIIEVPALTMALVVCVARHSSACITKLPKLNPPMITKD